MLTASTLAGIVVSEGTLVLETNARYARMHGYDPGEVAGKHLTDFLAPVERQSLREAVRSGREVIEEYRALRKDGSEFIVEVHSRRVLLAGRTVRITEARDASERGRTAVALQASEERFRCVLDNSVDVAYRRNLATNCYDYLSPAAEGVLGYTVAELERMPLSEVLALMHPEDVPFVKHEIARTLDGAGSVAKVEYRFRDKKGRYRWVADSFRMLLDGEGRPLYCVGFVRDIGERRAVEEELERRRLEVERSERLYRAIGESIDYGVWVCTPDGRNTYASESFLKLVGLTQDECSDFGWGKVLHPEDAGETLLAWRECVSTGVTWYREHRIRGADGKWHSILARGVPVRDPAGQIHCWAGINLDISRLKRAEARADLLAETAAQLLKTDSPREVIDALCRKVMRFLDCDAFFNLLADEKKDRLCLNAFDGITEEEVASVQWLDHGIRKCGCALRETRHYVVPDLSNEQSPCATLAGALGMQALACYALKVRDRVLGTLSFGSRSRPRFAGEELETMNSVADLVAIAIERQRIQSELKRANTELEQHVLERTRSLQETTDQLNTFCYSIAHDLRAPIRAQVGYAQLLLSKFGQTLGAEGRQYAERIADAAERQGELVGDLLAHMSLNRSELPLEPVDLNAAVRNARIDLAYQIRKRKASLEVGPLPACILANPASLHLILTNLLSNALKFVDRQVRPEVRIWSESRSGFVRLWVEDNGIGIPAESLSKLFGVFQRLHTRNDYPGTGIGLAIVRKAAQRMGGRVGVLSTPGKGSRFWLELPQVQPGVTSPPPDVGL
jgi:PAS domain S-box-containing protein